MTFTNATNVDVIVVYITMVTEWSFYNLLTFYCVMPVARLVLSGLLIFPDGTCVRSKKCGTGIRG